MSERHTIKCLLNVHFSGFILNRVVNFYYFRLMDLTTAHVGLNQ